MTPPLGSSDAYTPRAGGIADRSVKHLRANGETTHHRLADVLDVDPNAIYSSLSIPISLGVIKRKQDRISGTISYYVEPRLGDQLLDDPTGDVLIDDERPSEPSLVEHLLNGHVESAARAMDADEASIIAAVENFNPVDEMPSASGIEVIELVGEVPVFATPAAPALARLRLNLSPDEPEGIVEQNESVTVEKILGFRCAYYSDQQFVIVDDGEVKVLDPEKTKQLFAYVRTVLHSEAGPT